MFVALDVHVLLSLYVRQQSVESLAGISCTRVIWWAAELIQLWAELYFAHQTSQAQFHQSKCAPFHKAMLLANQYQAPHTTVVSSPIDRAFAEIEGMRLETEYEEVSSCILVRQDHIPHHQKHLRASRRVFQGLYICVKQQESHVCQLVKS